MEALESVASTTVRRSGMAARRIGMATHRTGCLRLCGTGMAMRVCASGKMY